MPDDLIVDVALSGTCMTSPGISELHPPAPARSRIRSLDVLRGFAILGILLLNIRSFSMNGEAYWFPAYYDHFSSLADRLTWLFGEIFWSHKFYSLLALLFGAGIVLMAEGAVASGDRPAVRHYRRVLGLFLLGILHAHLIWTGDILFQYAFSAAIAYPFRHLRPWKLVVLAIGMFAAMQVVSLVSLEDDWDDSYESGNSPELIESYKEFADREIKIYRGPWTGQFQLRTPEALSVQTAGMTGSLQSIGLMFLGMAALKAGWLGGQREPRFYLRMALTGCLTGWLLTVIGLIYWWNESMTGGKPWIVMNAWTLNGGAIAMLGYLAAIQWWVQSGAFGKLQDILEAVGRTALSNYLFQSLLATFIFHGQGFGLIGRVSRAGQLLFVLLIWAVQIGLTLWWLKQHRQGPAEMLLRKITGKREPT